jgi:hypothetical protein
MKNVTESWKTSIIGVLIIIASIVSIFVKAATWSDVIPAIVIGVGLLFAPDKLLGKIFLLLIFYSCNPVKSVINNKEKLDIVAKEVIKRGYCITDTVVVTKDSIIKKDSIIEKTFKIPCPDFDTTIDGTKIKILNGVLTASIAEHTVYNTKTITKSIRDLSLEKILKEDIRVKDSTILEILKENKSIIEKYNGVNFESRWLKIKLLLLAIVSLIIIFRKTIFKSLL